MLSVSPTKMEVASASNHAEIDAWRPAEPSETSVAADTSYANIDNFTQRVDAWRFRVSACQAGLKADSNATRRDGSPIAFERAWGLTRPDLIVAKMPSAPWPEGRQILMRDLGASTSSSDGRRS